MTNSSVILNLGNLQIDLNNKRKWSTWDKKNFIQSYFYTTDDGDNNGFYVFKIDPIAKGFGFLSDT